MATRWRDQGKRPNWNPVIGLTFFGLLATTSASQIDDPYLVSVVIELGTALLMFAALALAEPWLLSPLRKPRTITEAQDRLRPYVGSGAENDRAGTVSAEVKAATNQVRQWLGDAGFWMVHAAASEQSMTFVDWRYGAAGRRVGKNPDLARVEWTVSWSGGVLRHTVTVDGDQGTTWSSTRIGDEFTTDTRAQIDAFAHTNVLEIMCELVDRLEREPGTSTMSRLLRRRRTAAPR